MLVSAMIITLGSLCGFFDSFLFGLRDCLLLSLLLGNDFLFGFLEEEDFDLIFFFKEIIRGGCFFLVGLS